METRVIDTSRDWDEAWEKAIRVREALNETAQAGMWHVTVEPHDTGYGRKPYCYYVVIKSGQIH